MVRSKVHACSRVRVSVTLARLYIKQYWVIACIIVFPVEFCCASHNLKSYTSSIWSFFTVCIDQPNYDKLTQENGWFMQTKLTKILHKDKNFNFL